MPALLCRRILYLFILTFSLPASAEIIQKAAVVLSAGLLEAPGRTSRHPRLPQTAAHKFSGSGNRFIAQPVAVSRQAAAVVVDGSGILMAGPNSSEAQRSGDVQVPREVLKFATPKESHEFTNSCLYIVVSCATLAVVFGILVEEDLPHFAPPEGHPRMWLCALLLVSYAMLIPGIQSKLFSFNMTVELSVFSKSITTSSDGKPGAREESMISLIKMLVRQQNLLGALLVTFYAVVVPAGKLIALITGESLRHSPEHFRRKAARRCIEFTQIVSKWACPDMFAYIFNLYLFRTLDDNARDISAVAHLGPGFTCFSVFCLCSTVSTLAVDLPPQELAIPRAPLSVRLLGRGGVVYAAALLGAGFAALLAAGLLTPIVGLRVLTSQILAPDLQTPVLELLLQKLADDANSDGTLLQCAMALLRYSWQEAEGNLFFAFLMVMGFVITMTVLDMLLLLVAAWQLRQGVYDEQLTGKCCLTPRIESIDLRQQNEDMPRMRNAASNVLLDAINHPGRAMDVARVTGHLAMLDVFIMGVSLSLCICRDTEKRGAQFIMLPGMAWLAGAEALHYLTYSVVSSAVRYVVLLNNEPTGLTGMG